MCGLMAVCSDETTLSSFQTAFYPLHRRGSDALKIIRIKGGIMGFYRLAIMGLSEKGMQPMELHNSFCICNGEIYNYQQLQQQLLPQYRFHSGSDCEVLLALWETYGEDMFEMLDGEFALVIYDDKRGEWIAARDPMGIRPLFYGYLKTSKRLAFASEMKALLPLCDEIYPFPIGSYYASGKLTCYHDCTQVKKYYNDTLTNICNGIQTRLIQAVLKRMHADAPIGYLLSGGLDSSLVCSIAAKHSTAKLRTFAIGMKKDAIDLRYAREVAAFIGSEHTEFLIDQAEALAVLKELIYQLETYDITTIRASLGMYLLCKKIRETTDIKVLMSGEIADELFGYKYTDFAPDAKSFQKESEKRIRELYMYDVLRADRCISAHTLEARVPFSDKELIAYVMSIDPKRKMNHYGIGKYLLRQAFSDEDLPHHIRMREKAAFSDAVGHSLVDGIKAYAQTLYSDEEYEARRKKYSHATPFTKESLLYREIFESFYPHRAYLIRDFWMPNKAWPHCDVNDPSARVLINYGNSGV